MEQQSKRERALSRIKALLEKTVENGATLEEAKSSLEMAQKLMRDYFITIHDIEDLERDQSIVAKSVNLPKQKRNISMIYSYLSKLFDCRNFYTIYAATYVGYSVDVDVCIYMHKKIISGLFNDLEDFKKGERYKYLVLNNHGKTLTTSFVSGWVASICLKLQNLFKDRESRFSEENVTGLILSKKEKVDKEYQGYNVKTVNKKLVAGSVEAVNTGWLAADDFNLQDDLASGEDQNLNRLY